MTKRDITVSIFSIFVVFLFSSTLTAKEFKGVQMDDQLQIAGTTLKLNGMGLRRAFSMFDVYVGGLYLAEKSNDTEAILKSTTPKHIVLHFKRYLEKDKLKDAWEEGFMKNAEKGYTYSPDLRKVNDLMSNMSKDDKMSFTFFTDRVDVVVKDREVQSIPGAEFSRTMLKVFINNPPDADLKKGLLGKE